MAYGCATQRIGNPLHVGSTFTETDTSALARAGRTETFAVLMSNSVAGPGTGKFVSTRTGNTANLTGTAYYACGTIGIAATITDGRPSGKGVVRVRGKGSRGTFVLRGTATY